MTGTSPPLLDPLSRSFAQDPYRVYDQMRAMDAPWYFEAQDMLIRDELADDIRNQRYQEEDDEAEERERRTPGVAKDAKRLPPPRPNYPPAAWQRQIEGSVKVRVLVEVDGSISEFEILSAKPEGYFEQAIEDEVIPNLRYEPAEDADGNPLPSWDTFTYRFSLKDY